MLSVSFSPSRPVSLFISIFNLLFSFSPFILRETLVNKTYSEHKNKLRSIFLSIFTNVIWSCLLSSSVIVIFPVFPSCFILQLVSCGYSYVPVLFSALVLIVVGIKLWCVSAVYLLSLRIGLLSQNSSTWPIFSLRLAVHGQITFLLFLMSISVI